MILLAINIIFQLLLAAGILPADLAWDGRVNESTPASHLSSLGGLLVLGGFAYVLARRSGILGSEPPSLLLRVMSWLITFYLFLNSVMYYLSLSLWRKQVLGPLSLILAVVALLISAVKSSLEGGRL